MAPMVETCRKSWELLPMTPVEMVESPAVSPRTLRDPMELSLSLSDLDNTCEIYFCSRDSSPPPLVSRVSTLSPSVPEASSTFKVMVTLSQYSEDNTDNSHSAQAKTTTAAIATSSPSPTSSSSSSPKTSSRSRAITRVSSPKSTTSSSPPLSASLSASSSAAAPPAKSTIASALHSVLTPLTTADKSKKSKSKSALSSFKLPSIFSSTSSSSSSSSSTSSPTASSLSSPASITSKRPASFGGADSAKFRHSNRRASQGEKHVSWGDEYGSTTSRLTYVRLIRPRLEPAPEIITKPVGTTSTPGHSILRNSGAQSCI